MSKRKWFWSINYAGCKHFRVWFLGFFRVAYIEAPTDGRGRLRVEWNRE